MGDAAIDGTGGTGQDDEIEPYTIQQWVFSVGSLVRYDLARGQRDPLRLSELSGGLDRDLLLDYTGDRGTEELRAAASALYRDDSVTSESVLVTNGAQEALYLFYRWLLRPGDHAVTVAPGWQQSWAVPRRIGAEVSVLEQEPGARFDVAGLARLIRPGRTRVVTIGSPGNPSGTELDAGEWDEVLALAASAGVWVAVDEEFQPALHRSPAVARDRVLSFSGLSKIYGAPGLRIGWVAGARGPSNDRALAGIRNYRRYVSIAPPTVSEQLGVEVLRQADDLLAHYRTMVSDGLDTLRVFVAEHERLLSLVEPDGTPFAWVRWHGPDSSRTIAEKLLSESGVLVMPADLFGTADGVRGIDGFRVTFARPLNVLEPALDLMGRFLERLSEPEASP